MWEGGERSGTSVVGECLVGTHDTVFPRNLRRFNRRTSEFSGSVLDSSEGTSTPVEQETQVTPHCR